MHRLSQLAPSLRALRRIRAPTLLRIPRFFHAGRVLGRDAPAPAWNKAKDGQPRDAKDGKAAPADEDEKDSKKPKGGNGGNGEKTGSSSPFSFPINPKDWTPIPAWMGLLVVCWVGYQHVKRREARRRAEELARQGVEDGAEVARVEGPWHVG